MTSLDYSRVDGLLDVELMSNTTLSFIGAGGAANLIENLSGLGLAQINIVEFDTVSPTNPATQGYGFDEIGQTKASALTARIKRKNPMAMVNAFESRYEDLTAPQYKKIWNADMVLAMTDSFQAQALINKDAIKNETDAIFAICYINCQAIEITGTFIDEVKEGCGCHRCHTKSRYDAYEDGFANPGVIHSHIFAAEYLNAFLGSLIVSRLHQRAGSKLHIASVAKQFSKAPCIISRIGGPEYWANNGEPFAGRQEGDQLFATKQFALDTPDNWKCPDCGTCGVVHVS